MTKSHDTPKAIRNGPPPNRASPRKQQRSKVKRWSQQSALGIFKLPQVVRLQNSSEQNSQSPTEIRSSIKMREKKEGVEVSNLDFKKTEGKAYWEGEVNCCKFTAVQSVETLWHTMTSSPCVMLTALPATTGGSDILPLIPGVVSTSRPSPHLFIRLKSFNPVEKLFVKLDHLQ